MRISVYYDVRLDRVLQNGESGDSLVVVYHGQEVQLAISPAHAIELGRLQMSDNWPGNLGMARLLRGRANGSQPIYRFDTYLDQTLSRAPELDIFEYSDEGYNLNCIGWRNETNPAGFLAPKGIIPGQQGMFISDSTESFVVNAPYEFPALCASLRRDPSSVLRDFVAHACRLRSLPEMPRGDGLNSACDEAEDLIEKYLALVYGKHH